MAKKNNRKRDSKIIQNTWRIKTFYIEGVPPQKKKKKKLKKRETKRRQKKAPEPAGRPALPAAGSCNSPFVHMGAVLVRVTAPAPERGTSISGGRTNPTD